MSRFSPCRSLTLEGVCRDCACDCAMRSHSLMRVTGGTISCAEPVAKSFSPKGVNLITDLGFENHLSLNSPPEGNAIPTRAHDTPAKQPAVCPCDIQYPTSDSAANWPCAGPGNAWMNYYGQYSLSGNLWTVSSASPRSGTYHGRHVAVSTGFGPDLTVHTVVPRWGHENTGATLYAMSGSCANGDVITWSVYEKGTAGGGNAIQSQLFMEVWGSEDTRGPSFSSEYAAPGQPLTNVPGTYTKKEMSYIPNGFTEPVYFIVNYYPFEGNIGDTFDIDDASLVIT